MKKETIENTEEQELRQVEVEGESQNCRSAREYREFQKEWIKGACEQSTTKIDGFCRKCKKSYLRHHEARYVVQHGGLL